MKKIAAVFIVGISFVNPARAASQIDFDWALIMLGFGHYNANLLLCEQRPASDDRRQILDILRQSTTANIHQADSHLTMIADRIYSESKAQGCDRQRLATSRRTLDAEIANLRHDIARSDP